MVSENGVLATVRNVGAVEVVEIPLVPGAVTVLTGKNGAGKTTAANAVMAAIGGDGAGLTPRDGCESGQVSIDGVSVRIGKRLSRRGEPETFCIMEDGGDLQRFIDPGVKDPVSADERRIEAILTLAGVKVDREAIRALIGDDLFERFEDDADTRKCGIVDLVNKLARWLQKQARNHELEQARLEGEMSALPGDDGPLVAVNVKELTDAAQSLRDQVRKAEGARDAARLASGKILSLQTELVGLEKLQADVAEMLSEENRLAQELTDLQNTIGRLRESRIMLAETVANQRRSAKQLSELQEAMKSVMPDQEFAALQEKAAEAAKAMTDGIILDKSNSHVAANNTRRAAKKIELDRHEARGRKMRTMAARAPTLLSAAVGRLEGWSINEDMRLCCRHSRGNNIPFASLSPGEQAVRAIQVATGIRKKPDGKLSVVAVPQPIWESLDDANREIVQRFAQQNGLCILTAESSHGEAPMELQANVLVASTT